MIEVDKWFKRPLPNQKGEHAPAGGEEGCNGRDYKPGQFIPFYVPRDVMPQIDECDLEAFYAFAQAQGVAVVEGIFQPGQLIGHQRVQMQHVLGISAEVLKKPCLISRERYVLDGNHRWYRHRLDGTPVPAMQVMLDFEPAIELMFSFDKTYDLQLQGSVERN